MTLKISLNTHAPPLYSKTIQRFNWINFNLLTFFVSLWYWDCCKFFKQVRYNKWVIICTESVTFSRYSQKWRSSKLTCKNSTVKKIQVAERRSAALRLTLTTEYDWRRRQCASDCGVHWSRDPCRMQSAYTVCTIACVHKYVHAVESSLNGHMIAHSVTSFRDAKTS